MKIFDKKSFALYFFILPFVNLFSHENITSRAYKFVELSTNTILKAKSTNQIYPIASINKLFTYFIVKKYFSENEEIQVPNIPLVFYTRESRAGLKPKEIYFFSDLMYALLIPSGNDVARLLEYKLKQQNQDYSNLAKTWLKEQNFYYTNIEEAVGISSKTVSNIADLWKLLELMKNDPKLLDILKQKEYTIYSKSKLPLKFKNRNSLMQYKRYKIFGKTGSTKKAGFCFVGFLQNETKTYALVFLGAKDLEKELIAFIHLLE